MLDVFFNSDPYSLSKEDKSLHLFNELNRLTTYHKNNCGLYKKIIDNVGLFKKEYNFIEDLPYIPVSLFKKFDLISIKEDKIFKTLYSSGTTSNNSSKIFLDKDTALLQSKTLISIMSNFIGKKRLPLILVDSPATIKDRFNFSARGAGLLGMSQFANDTFYLLNDDMSGVKLDSLFSFLEKHIGEPILIFGFTFMVWQYLYQSLLVSSRKYPDLSNCTLIHSGGWKKMQDIAVDNNSFKSKFKEICNLSRIHNFYGMVEQVGSVYIECEEGHFHCPNFSEIIIRDPENLKPIEDGKKGLIQTLSILPNSYPGHSLLTEDIGVITSRDCKCGRKGTCFQVKGRVPKADVRGCSDVIS